MPALVELAGELTIWMAWLVLFGLLYAYRYSLGAAIGGLAHLIQGVGIHIPGVGTIHPFAFLANALHGLDNAIQGGLEAGITWSERGGIMFLQGTADLAAWSAYELERGFGDTLGALRRIGDVHIPNIRKWVKGFVKGAIGAALIFVAHRLAKALKPITKRLGTLAHRIAVVERDLAHWTGFTARQLRALLRRLAKLGYLAAYASVAALGGAILKKLHLAWLRQYATAAALVGAALATLGLSFTRCERVGRTGKQLCGMDSSLLDALLFDSLLIASLFSIRDFAYELQDITDESVSIMRALIREF